MLLVSLSACRAQVAPGPEPSVNLLGTVLVENQVFGSDYFNLVSAKFWHRLEDDCLRSTVSGCEVTSCSANDLMPADSSNDSVSVGALRLSGFTFIKQDGVTFEQPPYFNASPRPARMWSGGETIVVNAAGYDLPGFTGHTIAPPAFTASVAGCTAQSDCTIERSAPLELHWSPDEVGEVLVSLRLDEYVQQSQGPWPHHLITQVRCHFASTSSGANLEPALLSLFPSSASIAYPTGSVEITRRSKGFAVLDGGSVAIDADWVAVRDSAIFR